MPVKGLNETLRSIRNASEALIDDVQDIVEEYTQKIYREAQRLAPGPGDSLKTTYGTQKTNTDISGFLGFDFSPDKFKGRVFIEKGASELAIYLEFGTGSSAAGYVPTLEPEFQAIAQKYYINGKGTLIKHPFLLPAYFNNQKPFIQALISTLKSHGFEVKYIP